MSVAVLYPLFLAGGLVIAAPLWLHLFRRPESNLVRFSALRFLDDEPRARRQPLRLRDLALFLLRLLVVALVVSSFTWPYLRDATTTQVASESRVYLLDNTLSHQANGGFERGRDSIAAELERLSPDTQVAVVELSGLPRTLVAFGDDPAEAIMRVRSLSASFERGSYLAAFRMAGSLLDRSLGSRKRIIFVGDNQDNQWGEGLQSPPFLENVEVALPRIDETQAPNLAVSDPQIRRIFLGDSSVVDCMFKVYRQGPSRQAEVTITVDGRDVLRRQVEFPDRESADSSLTQPTGESFWLFAQWPGDPAAFVRGEIRITGEPDALPADNCVVFSLPPIREGTVTLLAHSPYLRAALSPDVMRGRWSARLVESARIADELSQTTDADVLILESQFLQAQAARDLLTRYLSHGRGVVLVVDQVTPVARAYLRELGIDAARDVENASDQQGFRYVFTEHPVFFPFRSPDFGNLMEIRVRRYHRLRAADCVPLLFAQPGDVLFFETTRSKARMFVSAFGFEREQTNWPLHPTFIPFLDLCLQSARAADPVPNSFGPNEVYRHEIPSHREVKEVVLRSFPTEFVRVAVQDGRVELRLPAQPGLYALHYDDGPPEYYLAVNPPPEESRLVYTPEPEAIDAWTSTRVRSGDAANSPVLARLELTRVEILRQRIWWWLLGVGGLALAVESMWLTMRKGRP